VYAGSPLPVNPTPFEVSLAAIPGLRARAGVELARYTTFRIGGPARLLAEVSSQRALSAVLRVARVAGISVQPLGLGSNVLIPDLGLECVVVRLVGGLRGQRIHGSMVWAGAGLPLGQLARRTAQRGLLGLEALSGFPSTVGGAVFMNAGCYGTEIKDVLVAATVLDADGRRRRMSVVELEPGYRSTILQRTGGFIASALFRLRPGDGVAALARIDELNAKRWASLPSGVPNAGSIFKNPPGDFAGRLIEACGLKGRRIGGAEISEKHANVIVNRGGASANDVLDLMIEAYRAVRAQYGVALAPEIVLTGSLRRRWNEVVSG
jgi:UDP-N-acetylmuramate dehydrogenase